MDTPLLKELKEIHDEVRDYSSNDELLLKAVPHGKEFTLQVIDGLFGNQDFHSVHEDETRLRWIYNWLFSTSRKTPGSDAPLASPATINFAAEYLKRSLASKNFYPFFTRSMAEVTLQASYLVGVDTLWRLSATVPFCFVCSKCVGNGKFKHFMVFLSDMLENGNVSVDDNIKEYAHVTRPLSYVSMISQAAQLIVKYDGGK